MDVTRLFGKMNNAQSLKFKLLFLISSLVMAVVGFLSTLILFMPFLIMALEAGNETLESRITIAFFILTPLLSFTFQPLKIIYKGTQLTWRHKLAHAFCSLAFLLIYYLTYRG